MDRDARSGVVVGEEAIVPSAVFERGSSLKCICNFDLCWGERDLVGVPPTRVSLRERENKADEDSLFRDGHAPLTLNVPLNGSGSLCSFDQAELLIRQLNRAEGSNNSIDTVFMQYLGGSFMVGIVDCQDGCADEVLELRTALCLRRWVR